MIWPLMAATKSWGQAKCEQRDGGVSTLLLTPVTCCDLELLQLFCLHLNLPGALLVLLLQHFKSDLLVLGGLCEALHGLSELLPELRCLPVQLQAAVLLLLQALGTDTAAGDPAPPKPHCVLCSPAPKGSLLDPPRALFLMSSRALWKFSVASWSLSL